MASRTLRKGTPRAVREPRHSLQESVRDGCAHAVMLGAGEAYLAPFGIFVGMGSLALGTLATLPPFISSLTQLGSVRLLDRVSHRRHLVIGPALVQGLIWLPLLVLALTAGGHVARLATLALVLAYHIPNGLMIPAWNSWMGDLVPRRVRGAYFGRREQLRSLFQLLALVTGGIILWLLRRHGREAVGFACIFAIAFIARMISVRHLARVSEPPYQPPSAETSFTLRDFLRRSPWSNFGRFTVYVAMVMLASSIASPFFSLFMLRDLKMSYLQFTGAAATVLMAQVLTLRAWGRLGDRFGNLALLKLTGFLVPLVPLLWLISVRYPAILLWQIFGGTVWAGFSLSSINFLFDAVSPAKRARCVAYYNVLVTLGTLAGALLGGALAPYLPAAIAYPGGSIKLVSGLQVLFLLSGLARLVCAVAFFPFIREVRPVQHFGGVFVRITGLGASRGVQLSILDLSTRAEQEAAAAAEAAVTRDPTRGPSA